MAFIQSQLIQSTMGARFWVALGLILKQLSGFDLLKDITCSHLRRIASCLGGDCGSPVSCLVSSVSSGGAKLCPIGAELIPYYVAYSASRGITCR